ncbi:MAG: AI-2E family transporter [Saprospiraceae bacterium]|nr:AI-2E family transporter [Saprospiraceae bacterium]MBP7679931.1 AI-2E family transporter [Saprospiraceae bacterium]
MIQNYRYYIALLIAVIIVWAAFYFFTDIVSYLLIAWVLSLIGQPFMRFFKGIHIGKFKINESIAAILTLICFAFIATGLVAAFVPLLVQQINELAKVDYAALQVSLSEPISKIDAWAHKYGMLTSNQNLIDEATNALKKWFDPSMFGDVFRTTLSTLSNLFVTIGSVTFITFFFLKDDKMFLNLLLAPVPTQYEPQVRHAVSEISRMLTRYFVGLLIQASIFSTIIALGLIFWGIPNALLIGLLGGLFNTIPYIGPIIGATMGCLIALTSNLQVDFYSEIIPILLKVIVTFSATQMLDNFVISTYVQSKSVQAHPLEIFLVVIMGAKLGGVWGMVLAIPTYTVLRVIAKIFLSEFKLVRTLTRDMTDETAPPTIS